MLLEVKDLRAVVRPEDENEEDAGVREILKGLSLSIASGEVHAIMGPNGSGKSTFSHVLAGKPGYEVTDGTVQFKGEDLLALEPEERAARGLFLAFQYPVEIPGVPYMQFLKVALNAQRKLRGEEELSTPDFMRLIREKTQQLGIPMDMLRRAVNVGFSGGEKKRMEVLQMAVLQPSLCILDEIDSGLDIDALKIVADGVNALRSEDRGFLLITHYQRLLDYIEPDHVHVMVRGRIVRSGGRELALELEREGYAAYQEAAA
ncbi:Fe-S cluster assembly ATPase SufC [Thermopetrobacter sp. TC1]|uniref:Fe-S cluster assembly ATPase SufC n=1 Tax=Thermopetrobacter sp. TC1 TaxID=1495045 RepID=UPI000570ECC9|nr:Fe-S cluster assembly ATPase SufC [Thermopetrobacter sp. TC1]